MAIFGVLLFGLLQAPNIQKNKCWIVLCLLWHRAFYLLGWLFLSQVIGPSHVFGDLLCKLMFSWRLQHSLTDLRNYGCVGFPWGYGFSGSVVSQQALWFLSIVGRIFGGRNMQTSTLRSLPLQNLHLLYIMTASRREDFNRLFQFSSLLDLPLRHNEKRHMRE